MRDDGLTLISHHQRQRDLFSFTLTWNVDNLQRHRSPKIITSNVSTKNTSLKACLTHNFSDSPESVLTRSNSWRPQGRYSKISPPDGNHVLLEQWPSESSWDLNLSMCPNDSPGDYFLLISNPAGKDMEKSLQLIPHQLLHLLWPHYGLQKILKTCRAFWARLR